MKPVLGLLFIALASGLLTGQAPVAVRAPADVRAKIESVIAAGRAPSIAVAIARDGRVVWSDAFGVADKTRRMPTTAATPYAVARPHIRNDRAARGGHDSCGGAARH